MDRELSSVNIFKTCQYGIFSLQEGNRVVALTAVHALRNKIDARNLLDYHPILVNKTMEIIDGQHRLEVAKALKYPISYIILPDVSGDIKCTQNINTTGIKWTSWDFLKSYCDVGNVHYLRFRDFVNAHPRISITVALELFSTCNLTDFKNGDFTSEGYSHASAIVSRLLKFKGIAPKLVYQRPFIRAIKHLHNNVPNIDYDRLAEQCRCNINILKSLPVDHIESIQALQRVYNTRLRNKINFSGKLL